MKAYDGPSELSGFHFLGYDVRDTRGLGVKILKLHGFQVGRVLSVDLTVCERYDCENSVDKTVSQRYDCGNGGEPPQVLYGGATFAQGLFMTYASAKEWLQLIPDEHRRRFEVIGYSVNKEEVLSFVTAERADQIGVSFTDDALLVDGANLEGYDVATLQYSWVSGLTNCGIDLHAAGIRISRDLTDSFLFRNVAAARKFRQLADDRIAAHAPFLVWQICTFQ